MKDFCDSSKYLQSFFTTFNKFVSIANNFTFDKTDFKTRNGFIEGKVSMPYVIEYTYFHRDHVTVLRAQIDNICGSGLLTKPKSLPPYSNLVDAKLRRNMFPEAKQYIKTHCGNNVTWSTVEESKTQSFIGALQLFCNKSQISLMATLFFFSPLHATLLNVQDKDCNSLMVSGKSVVVYLPSKFCEWPSDIEKQSSSKEKHYRTDRITVLHDSVKSALRRLNEVSVCGFKCRTTDEISFKDDYILCSYVTDLPETKDLLSLKRGM